MPDMDEHWMRRALDWARRGEAAPGGSPIGCVIVRDGQVLGEAHNEVEMRHDCTGHAEIVAMRRAGERAGDWQLRGATLYSTLQPCGMCSMASIWSKVNRIVYGARRDQVHRMYFEDWHVDTLAFFEDSVRGGIEVRGGLLAHECAALYAKPGEKLPMKEQANI